MEIVVAFGIAFLTTFVLSHSSTLFFFIFFMAVIITHYFIGSFGSQLPGAAWAPILLAVSFVNKRKSKPQKNQRALKIAKRINSK